MLVEEFELKTLFHLDTITTLITNIPLSYQGMSLGMLGIAMQIKKQLYK